MDLARGSVVALAVVAGAGCTAAATGPDDPSASSSVQSTPLHLGVSSSGQDQGAQDPPQAALATVSTNGMATGTTNGFFANLGTNGRTCDTCHVEENAWTFTPLHAQSLSAHDPLFAPVDGADCPPTSPSQGPDKSLSSEVTGYGLIRVQIGIPGGADFTLVSATNPKGCAIAPGSPAAGGQLFLFRRPLPATNLVFDTAVMWDGRESTPPSTQKITTEAGFASEGPLSFDLADQANGATMGHAQGSSIAGTQAQSDIVAFEANLYTGRARAVPGDGAGPTLLDADGANGGPTYIADTAAPAFFVGVNDPLQPGFTNASFTIYEAWEPTSPGYANLSTKQQAIGRGEAIFNGVTFVIHDVPGLNSVPGDPLYNPSDPLAGQDIRGGCGVCHNSPNVGNHSSALAINIGVTMAQPPSADGTNPILDVANLPVYTLTNPTTGATVQVTDPGRALITGKWTDIGKTKGPILRGLSMRGPFFHNGSAQDLETLVRFYDARFAIGYTAAQMSDLVEFLRAL